MKRLFVYFLALTCLCNVARAQQQPTAKKWVAIFAFDTTSAIGDVPHVRGESLGNKIADVLLIKLVQNGAYSVIERKFLEKVMAEQEFKYSDRFDRNSVARLGKALGVDGIIVGEVTHAAARVDCSKIGWGPYRVGGCTEKAVVSISARLVSTETAEIFGGTSAKAESKKALSSTTDIGGGGGNSGSTGGNGEAFSEAVHKAVEKMIQPLAAVEPTLKRVTIKTPGISNVDPKRPVAPVQPVAAPNQVKTNVAHLDEPVTDNQS